METLRRAVRNTLAQLGAQAVTWAATLVFTAALGRYLGEDGFGVLYLALSLTGIFGVLVDFGLQPLLTREIARRPELLSRYVWNALAIKLAFWVISFIAIQVAAVVLDYAALTRQVLTIYAVTMGLQSVHLLFTAVFRALQRLGAVSAGTILEKVLTMALGLLLLERGAGVVAMAWVIMLGAAANVAWQGTALARRLELRVPLDLAFARRLVLGAAPFAVYWALGTVYWRLDAVMLSKMTDATVVGTYGAAYRLFDTLLFLPTIVSASVMMPILARLSDGSRDAMRTAFEKGLNVLLVAGIPILAGMVVLAQPVLSFIYGRPEFQDGAPALRVLGVGVLVLYVNSATGWALVSLDRERRLAVLPAVGGVANVGLNLVMIPLWQGTGAALATVICELAIGAACFAMLPRWMWPRASAGVAARASLAAAGMAAVLVAGGGLPLPALVPLGGAVYAALALALRVVPREDLSMLRRAVKRQPAPVGTGS